jgi:hypothetical protein
MEVRLTVLSWCPPRAKPSALPNGGGGGGGGGGNGPAQAPHRPQPPPWRQGVAATAARVQQARRLQHMEATSAPSFDWEPSMPVFRAPCKVLLPKPRQAQALDLKMILHAEYGAAYTDMDVQYR